jgi:hypothetical protein
LLAADETSVSLSPCCRSFTLPASYWVGASRPSLSAAWSGVDGSPLPQNASNDPYAHFTWLLASYVGGRRSLWCLHFTLQTSRAL